MSYYKTGLKSSINWPFLPERVDSAKWGLGAVHRGGSGFYRHGLGGTSIVGANTHGLLGNAVDGIINILMDLFHVGLLIAGGWALFTAIRG